ncbi:DUF938 domain-containing protein [Nitrosomonas sp. Is37]|uniref:DUF938 domain-containing protein n=1 Tax=Nitrosomonas sp. Is37 TaxID=3080535 RepID=UPI00294AC929|nr:DUF938 domain-containing protein [Nitrosomonas sp. Is37]MDV6344948.1 DUF938 domain-containing protein [Nitrosomonas sp. Is37]
MTSDSGGMHINYFAPYFNHLHFQPSDKDIEVFDNIKKLTRKLGGRNITDLVHLDLTKPELGLIQDRKSHLPQFSVSIFFR